LREIFCVQCDCHELEQISISNIISSQREERERERERESVYMEVIILGGAAAFVLCQWWWLRANERLYQFFCAVYMCRYPREREKFLFLYVMGSDRIIHTDNWERKKGVIDSSVL
jgi:hypothetical protein